MCLTHPASGPLEAGLLPGVKEIIKAALTLVGRTPLYIPIDYLPPVLGVTHCK